MEGKRWINVYSIYIPYILIFALLSIIFSSFIALRSIDLKKIIAYSSIVHMNYAIFGLFSNDLLGLHGASYLNFSHAFVSSALFFLIGSLYKRYHTRLISYFFFHPHSISPLPIPIGMGDWNWGGEWYGDIFKGLFLTMPFFGSFFLFFSFASSSSITILSTKLLSSFRSYSF